MGSRWFLSTAAAVSTLVIGAGGVPVWSLDLPSAWMAVDSTRARLGDPLQLRLSLSFATGGEPRFPELTELPGGCVARSLPETAVRRHENGIEHAEMRYELRCYELGTHEIPPPEVAIFGPGADTLIRPPQALEIAIACKLSATQGNKPVQLPLEDRSLALYPSPYRLLGGDSTGNPQTVKDAAGKKNKEN